jgi:hypothetical protein
MKVKLSLSLLLAMAATVATALTISPAASAAPPSASISGTVTGTCSFLDTATGQTVNGTIQNGLFTLTGFSAQGGTLYANGTLTGVCSGVNSLGQTVTQTINAVTSTAVSGTQGACTILDLTLGPIHLDLLGLVVDTNAIHVTITAQQGPGNLLGNLLCGIANALNGGASANQLANLLNQLLAILG